MEIFFFWGGGKYALKSIFMTQKVKKQRLIEYSWLLHTPKKLMKGHLLGLGSESGPRRPDPALTKKVRIRQDLQH
jgi:hypothetical protein